MRAERPHQSEDGVLVPLPLWDIGAAKIEPPGCCRRGFVLRNGASRRAVAARRSVANLCAPHSLEVEVALC
jgi:hypothetical protein